MSSDGDMQGRIVAATGATSGIGEAAVLQLARQGARIVLVARNRARAQDTLQRLRSVCPGLQHGAVIADLSVLAECQRAVREIAATEPRIDVLINNAGAMFGSRQLTADGLERTFATNHLAYFILTLGLRDALHAAPAARVVNTASRSHVGQTLDFDDLQLTRHYGVMKAYGRSKLCNILFTRELARRWAGSGVTANCLHPGYVASRFADEAGGVVALGNRIGKLFAISPQNGARTIVHLASSPDVAGVSGRYFYRCKAIDPSPQAQDDAAAQRLWQESARLAGLGA
jgi:NAD(P)-dependent dehydrogenase (short-subunit alcohol dehydrogenase family)